ncbi:hypothetical protein D1007_39331 [Hordeum vulgare]|nr:hypothetical protein D1007_39331 [Hordeum vulgare]
MWLGETPLAMQYPILYIIVQRKEAYVVIILQTTPLNIRFRRSLVRKRWNVWLHLVCRLMEVQLFDRANTIHWKLTTSGRFLVKSMYAHLINIGPVPTSSHIWKIKVPLKIKIFMWFVHKGVILTKDNLLKRRWVGNPRCCFCDNNESIKHLFLECPLARLL